MTTRKRINAYLQLPVVLFITALLFSCSNETDDPQPKIKNTSETSPLDTILGDKMLNAHTGEIRENNFRSLLDLSKDELLRESGIYDVKEVAANHFILSQKKNYSRARNFNILIKTDNSEVADYVVFNDFSISDIKRDSSDWIVLLSDFEQTNTHWKSEQQIKIIKLDTDFNEIWNVVKNNSTPLSGGKIKMNSDNYIFHIDVITGCHICLTFAEFVLSKDGNFVSVRGIGKQNERQFSDEELSVIFSEN